MTRVSKENIAIIATVFGLGACLVWGVAHYGVRADMPAVASPTPTQAASRAEALQTLEDVMRLAAEWGWGQREDGHSYSNMEVEFNIMAAEIRTNQ